MSRTCSTARVGLILALAVLAVLATIIVTSFRAEITSAQWTDQALATTGQFSVSHGTPPPTPDNLKCQDSKGTSVTFEWEQNVNNPQLLGYTLQIQRKHSDGKWVDEGVPHEVTATNQKNVSKVVVMPTNPIPGRYRAIVTSHLPGAPSWKSQSNQRELEYKSDPVWDC